MQSYLAHQKDFSYQHRHSGLVIDLHWRLLRNRFLPLGLDLAGVGLSWMEIGAEHIPVLPPEVLLPYLCMHGALDGWLRLKWLADVAALVSTMSEEDLQAAAKSARNFGCLPELSAALHLSHQILGTRAPGPEVLGTHAARVSHILTTSNRLMSSKHHCPIRESFSTTVWFKNELALAANGRAKWELIERSLFKPRVWEWVNLPDPLFSLYAFISPLEWLRFRMKRATSKVGTLYFKLSSSSFDQDASKVPCNSLGGFVSNAAVLVEAVGLLTFFRIALRFIPVRQLITWMVRESQLRDVEIPGSERRVLRKIEWAIGAAVRHAPIRFVCFPQSLAAYFMLRRRGIDSKLFYGISREEQKLRAHTWIKVGDRTVVGGETESRFTVLAIFP